MMIIFQHVYFPVDFEYSTFSHHDLYPIRYMGAGGEHNILTFELQK